MLEELGPKNAVVGEVGADIGEFTTHIGQVRALEDPDFAANHCRFWEQPKCARNGQWKRLWNWRQYLIKNYLKSVRQRRVEIAMLHIGLNDHWRIVDVVFLLTGVVLG